MSDRDSAKKEKKIEAIEEKGREWDEDAVKKVGERLRC